MNYIKITKNDIANGIGVRTVLWVSGCLHCCPQCHNPQTWDINNGVEFNNDTIKDIFNTLEKPYISGITYSGGDPLHPYNRIEITLLAKKIRDLYPNKTQWLYTGYRWEEIKNLPILNNIDVLVDGEFQIEKRDITLAWRGSSNQRVINVQESLKQNKVVLWCE